MIWPVSRFVGSFFALRMSSCCSRGRALNESGFVASVDVFWVQLVRMRRQKLMRRISWYDFIDDTVFDLLKDLEFICILVGRSLLLTI